MVVTVDVPRDAFSRTQKNDLIRRVTDAMVAVEGEQLRHLTWVRICEYDPGNSAVGGETLTAMDLHRIAAEGTAYQRPHREHRPAAKTCPDDIAPTFQTPTFPTKE